MHANRIFNGDDAVNDTITVLADEADQRCSASWTPLRCDRRRAVLCRRRRCVPPAALGEQARPDLCPLLLGLPAEHHQRIRIGPAAPPPRMSAPSPNLTTKPEARPARRFHQSQAVGGVSIVI
jgi:hypothetical protein